LPCVAIALANASKSILRRLSAMIPPPPRALLQVPPLGPLLLYCLLYFFLSHSASPDLSSSRMGCQKCFYPPHDLLWRVLRDKMAGICDHPRAGVWENLLPSAQD